MHDQLTDLLKSAGFSGTEGAAGGSEGTSSSGLSEQNSATTIAIQEATQAINQLQAATQSSVDLASANTESSTPTAPGTSGGGMAIAAGDMASGLLGGGSSLGGGLLGGGLSLLFEGISSLFGGGSSQPPPLTTYVPPTSQDFELATANGAMGDASYDSTGQPRESDIAQTAITSVPSGSATQSSGGGGRSGSGQNSVGSSQQVTVQVQAMDSQSFMDRSGDIAAAVRQAMLNMHSVNDVISDL